MEKRKPSFDLHAIKDVCGDVRRLAITTSALRTAAELGFGRTDIAAVIKSMTPTNFYKSMTSHRDHRRWQDVYHVLHEGIVLYVKVTDDAMNGFAILSFKER